MSASRLDYNDAHTQESRWVFQTPYNAQDAPPRTPFVGTFNVPTTRQQPDPNAFQWLLYRPQDHVIPPFEYFRNTRAPSRIMSARNFTGK